MSSIVIKVGSLVIKTLSKPIATRIKAQAREHERFKRVCIEFAQGIHRSDMRFRLGLLQDTAAIEKQIAKDAAEAKKPKPPTVKTEAQTIADGLKEPEGKKKPPKIRPLSEAKAIELGANFVSETFLLAVGVALILFENARRGRQETKKEGKAADEVQDLKRRLIHLEEKLGFTGSSEPDEEDAPPPRGWLPWVSSFFQGAKSEVQLPARIQTSEVVKESKSMEGKPAASSPASVSNESTSPTREVQAEQIHKTADSAPIKTSRSSAKEALPGTPDAR